MDFVFNYPLISNNGNVDVYDIPNDFYGTEATILQMQKLVSNAKQDWDFFIKITSKIIRNCPHKDKWAEVNRIFKFVKKFIRYEFDPYKIELVQAPIKTLERRAGDCDDLCIVFNTFVECIGLKSAFKTIKADKERPNEFSHVYSLARIGKDWIGADCSVEESYLGWEPPKHFGNEKIWNGSLE